MDKRIKIAYLELSLAMIIVGSSVVIGKLVIASFPIFLASALRFGLAVFILVPYLYLREGNLLTFSKRDGVILGLQAFTGVFLFNVFLLYGLKFTSAAEAGIITSTTPAVVAILSFLFLKERLTLNKAVGIALVVFGILIINVLGDTLDSERGQYALLGNVLIFGAVLGEAAFTIFPKIASQSISPLRTATVMSVLGLLMFMPFALYEAFHFDFTQTTLMDWGLVIYLGVVVTVVAFLLWFGGVRQVMASEAAVFTGVMPVSAVLLSYLILGEPFAWAHVWGILFVVAGIGFLVRKQRARTAVSHEIGA